jgi:hypothetical protein
MFRVVGLYPLIQAIIEFNMPTYRPINGEIETQNSFGVLEVSMASNQVDVDELIRKCEPQRFAVALI